MRELDDSVCASLSKLVKGKVGELLKIQEDVTRQIQEWESICAALVAAPAPPGAAVEESAEIEATTSPPAPSDTRVSLSETPKKRKNSGRFPYRDAETQKYEVGKNTVWICGDLVAIARKGYDKKARLTVAALRGMDEEKLRVFGNDKARAVLRIAMGEVDFSSMPPKAKKDGVAAEAAPIPIKEIKISYADSQKKPKLRAGSGEYVTCPDGIAISRDGYHHHVYLSYPDFFSLAENPERVDTACASWHKLKRSLLRGFLKDITPEGVAQIRKAQGGLAHDDPEDWKYKKILNTDTKVPREDYTKIN